MENHIDENQQQETQEKNLSYRPIKTTGVLCVYNVFTIISMIGMIGFTLSYGEMFFHSNFLASGGSSVQNIMSKTISIQKNAQVKLISCPKCLKLPAGLVKSSMETGKL